jgi:chromosome segregation ATPase
MQVEVDSCADRIKAIDAERASKDAQLSAAEAIIKDQASLIDSRSKDIQESTSLLSSLRRDVEDVGMRLRDSISRNHAIRDQMAIKERLLLSVNAELTAERQRNKKMMTDKRFCEEKEQYLDRMLLQISAELDDVKKIASDRESYVHDMQSDIGRLNARISELHHEIIERDKNIAMLQEKFFYLRVRPLSRLLVKLGVYKVPHE